ncbi:hypothetical protein FA13DRAFT_1715597 [Coprinellus micaceus]|uniref:Uncharacterized protein n=1 Tax=Coprinellus micaceus TaxID=71717 RepID=A0A4Y7SP67_COPMI|nr:hypothetical protein FA13DRAFT_1715597 [Coprinellus micaceus]
MNADTRRKFWDLASEQRVESNVYSTSATPSLYSEASAPTCFLDVSFPMLVPRPCTKPGKVRRSKSFQIQVPHIWLGIHGRANGEERASWDTGGSGTVEVEFPWIDLQIWSVDSQSSPASSYMRQTVTIPLAAKEIWSSLAMLPKDIRFRMRATLAMSRVVELTLPWVIPSSGTPTHHPDAVADLGGIALANDRREDVLGRGDFGQQRQIEADSASSIFEFAMNAELVTRPRPRPRSPHRPSQNARKWRPDRLGPEASLVSAGLLWPLSCPSSLRPGPHASLGLMGGSGEEIAARRSDCCQGHNACITSPQRGQKAEVGVLVRLVSFTSNPPRQYHRHL